MPINQNGNHLQLQKHIVNLLRLLSMNRKMLHMDPSNTDAINMELV